MEETNEVGPICVHCGKTEAGHHFEGKYCYPLFGSPTYTPVITEATENPNT